MQPHVPNTKWTYVVFSAFFIVDMLMAARIIERLVLHNAPISPDGPLFFLVLVALQVVVLRLLSQLRQSIRHYQGLKRDYERELDLSRQVMECAEEGLTVLDELGRFVYVNAGFAALVGLEAQALLGRTPQDFVMQATPSFWEEVGESAVVLRHASGQMRAVRIRSQPRWYAGRMVGHIVSAVPEGMGFETKVS